MFGMNCWGALDGRLALVTLLAALGAEISLGMRIRSNQSHNEQSLDLIHFHGLPGKLDGLAKAIVSVDANGRPCSLCGTPFPGTTDRAYVQRTDCGNHSPAIDHSASTTPLITFSRPASDGKPATNAWCELNLQKICADSIVNRDFLYQAKTLPAGFLPEYDFHYCKLNGYLDPEIVALQNDFDAMDAKGKALCNEPKYLQYGWNSTLTLDQMEEQYKPGLDRGYPTLSEAEFIGAWTCAMGSNGCDMAYCAYSWCDKGNGNFGQTKECEGWDPIKGMPIPADRQ